MKGTKPIMTFPITGTVGDAMDHLARQGLGCTVAINPKSGDVAGLFTARDILRFIMEKKEELKGKGGSQSKNSLDSKVLSLTIKDLVTPPERILSCTPDNSVTQCRRLMFEHKIRHVPVIENGELIGMVTGGDLSDTYFQGEAGGKRAFLEALEVGMKGLPQGVKLNTGRESSMCADAYDMDRAEQDEGRHVKPHSLYGVITSHYAMPHPYKSEDGCANSARQYGARDLCTDITFSEDSSFTLNVKGQAVIGADGEHTHTYLCVADGVGSWRQYGIDPRQFAHTLVKNTLAVIESDEKQRLLMMETSGLGDLSLFDPEPISPLDAVMDAWSLTRKEQITGSSTICVAALNNETNRLDLSNIGDCGLMVLRHMDSETAGYMRDRDTPRHLRDNDLRIAFLSQQQLKSFNLPYQLGYSGIEDHVDNFETPTDAANHSMTVLPGDIIVLATDGLFDNLDLDDLVTHINEWESRWFGKLWCKYPLDQPGENTTKDQEAMDELARSIVHKARELSLDKSIDSPFALLAKDNDIMWSGGMPDDTTVVIARVTTPHPTQE
jgi:protein phosphatase PTC7